jgi:hypothetical protein
MGCSSSKKDENEPEKPGFLSRSPYYELKQLVGIGMTIACMVLAILAYIDLSNYTSDVQSILKNWKTKPLIDVYITNFTNVECAEGYTEMGYPHSDFTGVGRGHCGCTPNIYSYVSAYPNCSSEVEAIPDCQSAKSLPGIAAKSWRREKICIKRGGIGSVSFANGYFRRPYPDEHGNCPDDYKKCGTGNYQDDRAICFPSDTECPITGLLIAASQPSGGSWTSVGNFTHDGLHLYARREYPGELPAVEFSDALTRYKGDYFQDNYNGKNNNRGPCYMGSSQKYSRSVVVSEIALVDYAITSPSQCQKPDPRYVLYDRVPIEDHYLGAFDQSAKTDCAGFPLYSSTDTRFNPALDPDYLESGIKCGPAPYECNRDLDMGTNCDASDTICDLVVNQNVCGQYVQAARGISKSADTFGLYRRGEILWDQTCEVDREAIYTNNDPVSLFLSSSFSFFSSLSHHHHLSSNPLSWLSWLWL